ncbi:MULTISPECIES: alpha/beta hydrolase [Cupriavidus]|uniref:Serine aminopeptidase S33 domain-containing protein n=1 Tax=Cupriavidus pinatubonensis (strain JMP 134 / LMG 1197) TaxID=264198 RepID=Q46T86_CUPPJ|nr:MULTISPECIES: alpha/beta fold hydrolase [Cupriavidus]QYY28636.1 lysophospholipase [Cupriavidus pinatubonensis]TPQ41395.1 alpha/beta hydrolase [Cupriavidus pinatubonensis]
MLPHSDSPIPRWLAGTAGVAVLAGLARHLLFRALEREAFVTPPIPPQGGQSETTLHASTFASGGRVLHAAFAPAATAQAPALMVCHGDDECLSDWAPVQTMLSRAGISTFVFDYSGYGASSGRPTVRHLREDARAAYRMFLEATPAASRRYVLGHSLGSGVLLDVARELRPVPDGMIIASGFSSARAAAVQTGKVPARLAWLLPDPWNNLARTRRLNVPLLVLHSRDDEVLPFAHSERLAQAASRLQELVLFDGMPHDAAILPDYIEAFWAPIIAFMLAPQAPRIDGST